MTQTTALQSRIIKTENVRWKFLQFIQQETFKEWISAGDKKLLQSLLKYQFADPFKVWEHEEKIYCLDGFHRYQDLLTLEKNGVHVPEELPATFVQCTDINDAAELVLVYSSIYANITQRGLFDFIQMYEMNYDDIKSSIELPAFDEIQFEGMVSPTNPITNIISTSLRERFIIPPFSIFDTRQGYWQERKKQWHSLGFDSQESREAVQIIAKSGQAPAVYELRNKMRDSLGREPEWDEIIHYARKKGLYIYEGGSVFDPVIAELCYKWFCPPVGKILDPFAGGSVRGIVAGVLDYQYLGIDLRKEQVEANRKQWEKLNDRSDMVTWVEGDSNEVLTSIKEGFDFVFSCPPYHDLEKYSDDPRDLSNMDYAKFAAAYKSIIIQSVSRLKENRFACFVVADIRDEKGFYRNFLGDTIDAFQEARCLLYNEIILINVAGSLPVRIGRQFEGYRKVGKMHQNVLVFYKGDPKKIKEEFPKINVVEDLQHMNYQPNIALSVVD